MPNGTTVALAPAPMSVPACAPAGKAESPGAHPRGRRERGHRSLRRARGTLKAAEQSEPDIIMHLVGEKIARKRSRR
jgi:hypothetical protein